MQGDVKKQMPVLIALSLVLVLAVTYSVKKSMSRPGAGAEPPAQQQEQQLDARSSDNADESPTAMAEPSGGGSAEMSAQFVGNPPRDPFEPRLSGEQSAQPVTPGNRPAAAAQGARRPGSFPQIASRTGIPPLPIPGLPGPLRVEGAEGAPAPAQPEAPPFLATGVVRGAYDIAILRGEGGGRFFVREGQSVGDGYVVKSISPVGVVLKSKDRSTFLKLGGSQDASASARPRQEGK